MAGHDPGASAFGISEAELVLDVTLRLEKLLQQQPGIEVVLTRRTNEYVSLDERTEIANRESADLFLSVHANASSNGTARGVETYFLNFALNPQAEAVAARENAASGKTMSSLPSIIKAITLNSKLNESRDFAASIQRSLVRGMRGGQQDAEGSGREAGAVHGADWRSDAERARGDFVRHQPAGGTPAEAARLPPAHCGVAAGGNPPVSAVAEEGADSGGAAVGGFRESHHAQDLR